MDDRYAHLLSRWKRASAQTRAAQAAVNAQFDSHFKGNGPAPDPRDVERLMQLRELESASLRELLDAIAAAARRSPAATCARPGPPVEKDG
jgi:hypothetical protein